MDSNESNYKTSLPVRLVCALMILAILACSVWAVLLSFSCAPFWCVVSVVGMAVQAVGFAAIIASRLTYANWFFIGGFGLICISSVVSSLTPDVAQCTLDSRVELIGR